MKIKMLAVAVAVVSLSGCVATNSEPPKWQAVSGDKGAGTVQLGFFGSEMWGASVKYPIDDGKTEAVKRCERWGYTDAEPFGLEMKQCQTMTDYGCSQMLVSREWQCID